MTSRQASLQAGTPFRVMPILQEHTDPTQWEVGKKLITSEDALYYNYLKVQNEKGEEFLPLQE